MTYVELALCFVGAALVASAALWFAAPRRRPRIGALALTLLALVILTAVFDTVMIAFDLFHYSPTHLLGVHIGLAPLEDFAYPVAGALLLPSIWVALRGRRRAPRPSAEDEAA